MTIGEEDWVLLNGYADGELDAAGAAILRRRLGQEPALAEELARIQALKGGLAGLAPRPVQPAAPQPSPTAPLPVMTRTRSPIWSLAAAVTLLVAIGFSAFALLSPAPQPLQQALLEPVGTAATGTETTPKEVAALETGTARGSRLGEIVAPDLTASNLSLSEMALRRDGEAESVTMHYLGPNGCRVTLVARELDLAALPEPAPLSAEWQTARARYSLTAEGMDPARFQAIASYAEAQVRQADEQEMLRLALQETTAKSHPCA